MKTLLTTIAAAMFFAAACTQSEKESANLPILEKSVPEGCDFRKLTALLDTVTMCESFQTLIAPCADDLCKNKLAEVVNYADEIAANSSFGPCDWSWLPPGLPCE